MIETLHELASQAGMSRINISIQSTSENEVAVTLQSIPHPLKDGASDEQKSLRHALASPIIVKGLPGEIEAKFDDVVDDYMRTVKPASTSIESQIEGVKKKIKGGKEDGSGESDDSSEQFTDPEAKSL